LVFRTQGQWLQEYLRAYVIYGGVAIFGIFLLWLFVNTMGISIWLAQGMVIVLTVAASYIGHTHFTFRAKVPVDN
jgi:putative flippase GtrA